MLIAIEGELQIPSQQMGRDLGQGGQQDGKIGPRDAIDPVAREAADGVADEGGDVPDVGIPGLEAALGVEGPELGGADEHQDGGLGVFLLQQLGQIAPEGVAVAKARHLVPGRLIVQFGDLAVGIDLGLIEGRKELAQSRLCLYAVEHGGIPLLQRQQPALLLPRLFPTAHAVGEKEQQGESRQGGHQDQQQGER